MSSYELSTTVKLYNSRKEFVMDCKVTLEDTGVYKDKIVIVFNGPRSPWRYYLEDIFRTMAYEYANPAAGKDIMYVDYRNGLYIQGVNKVLNEINHK